MADENVSTQPNSDALGTTTNPKTPEEQANSLFGTPTPSTAAPTATPASEAPKAPEVVPLPQAPSIADLEKAVAEATTPEAKAAAQTALDAAKKPTEEAGKTDAPLTMEALKVPEGVKIEAADGEAFLKILNDKDLAPAQRAQALVDLQAKVTREASERGTQAWLDLQTQWQEQAIADSTLGGEKLQPALGDIAKAIDAYAPDPVALRQLFDTTGFGNNIVGIRFLHTLVQKANATEGTPATGRPTPMGTMEQSQAKKMYPNLA